MSRAVVLSSLAAGLRASAWLAARGAAVRHLGIGVPPSEARWTPLLRGVVSDLTGWLGPVRPVRQSVGVWFRGKLQPMPTRRRDLASLVRGAWLSMAQDMRPRLRAPGTLGQWGLRSFGKAGWQRCLRTVLSKRLGVSCDGEPAALAGLLAVTEAARWTTPMQSAEEARKSQVDAVLGAGGDVVFETDLEGLEVRDGRVRSVLTEFGREHVDDRLVSDLAPWRLAEMLPRRMMSAEDVRALRMMPTQERALVEVHLRGPVSLPWTVWVADAQVPVVEVRRAWGEPGAPAEDRLMVELQSHPGEERAAEWARSFAQSLAPVVRVGEVKRITQPLPVRDPRAVGAQRRLYAMGVTPVGATAWHRPYTLEHEARLAVGRPRPEMLTLPPTHHGILP